MGVDDPNMRRNHEIEDTVVLVADEVPAEPQPMKQSASAQEKMNTGAAWMSAASMISRILGVLYVIPWYRWMGDPQIANEANSLFNIGYNYYAIFLSITIAGVPDSIAKQMAYYNARGQYKTGRRLFRSGLILMSMTGILGGILLWTFAPQLAQSTPARNFESVVLTIRSLVPALVILPTISVIRGYFQGHQDMKPSAMSQIAEQILRVIYMLAAVYIIRIIRGGDMVLAVTHSTFAAFIGALAALATLAYFFFKYRKVYAKEEALYAVEEEADVSTVRLLIEIISIAIPFIISGSAIELSRLIDLNTYMPIMERVSDLSRDQLINEYAIFGANANKLVTIIVSLAVAIGSTSISVISATFSEEKRKIEDKMADRRHPRRSDRRANHDFPDTKALVMHNLKLFTLVMLPSAIGMAVLAEPVYAFIYSYDPMGTSLLQLSAFVAITMGLFAVLVAMMQSMSFFKEAIFGLLVGMIIKLALQLPMLAFFGTPGAQIATAIAFVAIAAFYLWRLHVRINFSVAELFVQIRGIVILAAAMGVATWLVNQFLRRYILSPEHSLFQQILQMVIVAAVGVLVYGIGGLRFKILDILLGDKAKRLRAKLGMSKYDQ
jgi:O-antigen/teichoic acid export membrane protein